jgi:hypothetical protein
MIRAVIEAHVNERKAKRVAREREPLVESRKIVVKQVYTDYKKTLVPTQWAYHPGDNQVYKFKDFAALINNPSNAILGPQHCHSALQKLPSLVNAFNEEKKSVLLSLLNNREGTSSGSNSDNAVDPGRSCLDVATSIFQCTTPGCQSRQKPLIAWQRAICHTCDGHRGYAYGYSSRGTSGPEFKFSERGSKAVESLAMLLELNVLTAVPADYDRKAARFVCSHCNTHTRSGIHGHETMTWRDCVRVLCA